jgi:hypothetical protein
MGASGMPIDCGVIEFHRLTVVFEGLTSDVAAETSYHILCDIKFVLCRFM